MQATADWGMGWVILAHAVTWTMLIGYTLYLRGRVARAREALDRELEMENAR